jgi:hypothetical protein
MKLTMPSPEDLGLKLQLAADLASKAPEMKRVDWDDLRSRLQRMGALSFRVDRVDEGGFRVMFLLPGSASGHQVVEAVGVTEHAAVQMALRQAESTVVTRK